MLQYSDDVSKIFQGDAENVMEIKQFLFGFGGNLRLRLVAPPSVCICKVRTVSWHTFGTYLGRRTYVCMIAATVGNLLPIDSADTHLRGEHFVDL